MRIRWWYLAPRWQLRVQLVPTLILAKWWSTDVDNIIMCLCCYCYCYCWSYTDKDSWWYCAPRVPLVANSIFARRWPNDIVLLLLLLLLLMVLVIHWYRLFVSHLYPAPSWLSGGKRCKWPQNYFHHNKQWQPQTPPRLSSCVKLVLLFWLQISFKVKVWG